jgi:hypothetical protein
MGQDCGQEFVRDLARQQPVAVVREARGVPNGIIDAEPDKPAEQQVELDALDQLRSERIE